MRKQLIRITVAAAAVLPAWPASAQDAATPLGGLGWAPFVGTLLYSLLGLIILLVAFKVFDWVTPYKLHKELAEDQNVAVGVMLCGIFIALAIIIAAAIV